jgi:hypothetical protein
VAIRPRLPSDGCGIRCRRDGLPSGARLSADIVV